MDDLSPMETYAGVESAVKALADRNNLCPCLWGYPQDGKLTQLAQENIRAFISWCWTNTIYDIVLSVHLQEAFVGLPETPREVDFLSENVDR